LLFVEERERRGRGEERRGRRMITQLPVGRNIFR
jgi:hypothetical protein